MSGKRFGSSIKETSAIALDRGKPKRKKTSDPPIHSLSLRMEEKCNDLDGVFTSRRTVQTRKFR